MLVRINVLWIPHKIVIAFFDVLILCCYMGEIERIVLILKKGKKKNINTIRVGTYFNDCQIANDVRWWLAFAFLTLSSHSYVYGTLKIENLTTYQCRWGDNSKVQSSFGLCYRPTFPFPMNDRRSHWEKTYSIRIKKKSN